ncbi:NAD(P)-binding domain-containing protein [Streptomyces pathocidini]|uniref:NADPH-dependent F420 reductase n=1 Tax=Streptomyces pathocidini TaxID=1650571 RepID=UPI0033D1A91D
MKYGVLGTGDVGRTLAGKLVELGHDVVMGSRSKSNEKALAWASEAGPRAGTGTFAEAAAFGERVVNAVTGTAALEALEAAGAAHLGGKLLIDVCNPLFFEEGRLRLSPVESDSVGARIQRRFPDARVVKALNTVNCQVMVEPGRVPGDHQLFVCGDSAEAKADAVALLGDFGWPAERILDLGGIESARCTEMLMPFWFTLMRKFGHADFNYEIRHGTSS